MFEPCAPRVIEYTMMHTSGSLREKEHPDSLCILAITAVFSSH